MTAGLRVFQPALATAAGWSRYHEFRRVLEAERRPEDPTRPDQVVEYNLKREDPADIREIEVLEREGRVIGVLETGRSRPGSPGYPSGGHILGVDAQVLPEARRSGLARSWLPHLAGVMDATGTTIWNTWAELPSGIGFLEAIGARRVFSGSENRLRLADVDWTLIEEWSRIDSGFRLELHEPRLSEGLFDTFCAAYTLMGRGVPMEEMEHGEWITTPERMRDNYARMDVEGSAHHLLLAYDGAEVVGVTEYIQRPYEPMLLHQELTAVDPRAQGRGLGKQLKAVLLLHMRELYPDLTTVITDNAGSNAPMLSINTRMGFRPYRAGHGYQMTRQELDRLL